MSIKKKIGWFTIIILTLMLIGYFSNSSRSSKSLVSFNNWFNGWITEELEMRKTYHLKLNSLTPIEMSNQDYQNLEKLKKYRLFIDKLGQIELWKNDKSLEIDENYYSQIDKQLGEYSDLKEQLSFLKLKFKEGIDEGKKFRQVTDNYINDQLSFIDFLLEKNCNLKQDDEKQYNLLSSKVENSSRIYNSSVNYIYNYNLQRVKEFNKQFKNENLNNLIQTIEKGQ